MINVNSQNKEKKIMMILPKNTKMKYKFILINQIKLKLKPIKDLMNSKIIMKISLISMIKKLNKHIKYLHQK